MVKFIYFEKATKFWESPPIIWLADKKLVEILQNFVAFSEYMNFNSYNLIAKDFQGQLHIYPGLFRW